MRHNICISKVLAKNLRFATDFDSSCGEQARFAHRIVRFAHNMAARPFLEIFGLYFDGINYSGTDRITYRLTVGFSELIVTKYFPSKIWILNINFYTSLAALGAFSNRLQPCGT